MQATNHLPSLMGTLDDLKAASPGFVRSHVPMCPPPCTCVDCETYYYAPDKQQVDRFRYTSTLTDAESRSLLKGYMKDICEAQRYLRKAIQQNGDYVLSRWRKLTQTKRVAMLQQVEPDLPLKKGLIADLESSGTPWRTCRKYRKYFLLPYLDVYTLSKNPSTLIGLLNTRAKNPVEEWAPFDHNQLRNSWGQGLFDSHFNVGAVILHGPNYGTLTKWEAQAAHRFDQVGFPRAQLIIEAQATLLRFLRQVVEKLLTGLPDGASASATKWDAFIESGLKMEGDTVRWSSFVNQPFTAPPRFDVDNLVSQVSARCESTNDHLWLLQTEPSYFKRYMHKIAQMQSVETIGRSRVGLVITNGEIIADIDINQFWRHTLLEFKHLQELYHRYRDSITPGAPLPIKVDNALGALELILVNQVHTRALQLFAVISQRPGFRHIYDSTRVTECTPGRKSAYETSIRIKERFTTSHGETAAYHTERLWWILMQLQGEPDLETRFPYAMLLDMLNDHLAKSPPAERERLDEILYEKLSDYVTLLELLWAIRMHCPRNKNRTVKECERTEDRLFWRASATGTGVLTRDATPIGELSAFEAARLPSGPRNGNWLQKFETAHQTLQEYWRKTFHIYERRNKVLGLRPDDVETNMEPLSFWKDPKYMAQLETKRTQILADTKKLTVPDSEDIFLPFPTTPEVPIKLDILPSKTKVKTRGEARSEESAQDEEAAAIREPTPAKIALPKRSYATFRYMFPTGPEERLKDVNWETFVMSMENAGFTARNGGGSIVMFEDENGGGKINFHKPHPDPSIDPVMLQSMGRRMNKWFGWTRETFSLAGK
ncbi:uncharacterized protein K460DRAFT_279546 [Cucurbitaria berberidis CBS 394.84]|uniref:Uncharacterized protein n=1 Tax=Cucurbitaria berberidis CBS 394.84 TaxID=1168544 RepID=A0A9P4GP40_9PLEO|nr:uncharacterized protein K460DRAFT_279546 [Cucurbitaria berberidis CBS 394.84]KAF1849227.1 hypothetical protein K460DRAFT_279546 [Cucurbitaria berberidis CBS 394.84]